jgi:DNA-binding CsgD family transcriptional regulator
MTLVDDSIIHRIYSCATGDLQWDAALRPIMALIDAKCAGVVRHSIAPTGAEVLARIDVDPETEQSYLEEYVHKNPVMNCLSAMPLGYITYGSGAVDQTHYLQSSFYRDWQLPAGYADNLGISLARRNGEFVLLSLPRDLKRGTYTPQDTEIIKPYVQHLVRAFNIWLRLYAAESRSEWVDEALDQVGKGLIILGEDRVILYANKNAEKVLLGSDGLRRTDFRLVAATKAVQDLLDEALAEFELGIADETRQYGFSIGRTGNRPPLYVRVQPPLGVKPGQRSFGLPKAVAFLHVVDPEARDLPDVSLFGHAHALTGAEQRFLEAVVRTESIVDAAQMLSLSEATGRTHIQRICAKTGARNFVSLIALVHRSTNGL